MSNTRNTGGRELATGGNDSVIPPWRAAMHTLGWMEAPPCTHARFGRQTLRGKGKVEARQGVQEITNQLRVSGEMVRSLLRCFCQVRQEAFSRRTPLAISCLWRVMLRHDAQTSSSVQLCDR